MNYTAFSLIFGFINRSKDAIDKDLTSEKLDSNVTTFQSLHVAACRGLFPLIYHVTLPYMNLVQMMRYAKAMNVWCSSSIGSLVTCPPPVEER